MGTEAAIIVKAPFWRPEEPSPATARPMMSIVDEVATPQSSDPSSKTAKKMRKVHCDPTARVSSPLELLAETMNGAVHLGYHLPWSWSRYIISPSTAVHRHWHEIVRL